MTSSTFEDKRGRIEDILAGPIDSVTEIVTKKGAVRGNHVHHQTTQWTYVVSGQLEMARGDTDEHTFVKAGALVEEHAGVPHAWKAVTDCVVLVFTRGPRSGVNYESDTVRLDIPLLVPGKEPFTPGTLVPSNNPGLR